MSSPESTNGSRFNSLQKLGAWLWVVWTAWYGLYNPNWLWNIASWAASSVNDILQAWGEMANDAIGEGVSVLWSNIPMFAAAAPFVAPTIAGAYLGKKVADITGTEKKWLKIAASAAWAWVWLLATASVAAPYLTSAAVATAAFPLLKWGAKYAGKTVSSTYGGVVWAAKWGVQGILLWGYNGAKNNWDGGHVNPNTWITMRTPRAS